MTRRLMMFFALSLLISAGPVHSSENTKNTAEQFQIDPDGWDWVRADEEISTNDQEIFKVWDGVLGQDFEAALAQLEASDGAWSHLLRAMAYSGLEEFGLAVSEARSAIELAPSHGRLVAEAHNQLGLALMRPVLEQISTPADPADAYAILEEAEVSFQSAFDLSVSHADGVLLNLAACWVAQSLLDLDWNRWVRLDGLLRSISTLLPEYSKWAEDSLEADPVLPDELVLRMSDQPPVAGRPPYDYPIYFPQGNVSKPNRTSYGSPQYTEAARAARIQGVVIVRAVIDDRGEVARVQVLQSLDPGLDQQAVKAISQSTFDPATLDGEPVWCTYNLTLNFQLQ